ncbi:hypothetical protein BHE97_08200 [Aeromicrobium sp. PE09-221]|uniref:VOC family protein n=1 Tax=Aeromicrobium sp. PE09-221 TaxID=1898043 RepID=UPI000B3E4F78|nr:VOC family protein [Aeromicrobium sp. PE09-221]OUZ10316.1 hypothetical protein BHE97_08200 [Aeromicrobium sp. PE09-221]
MSRVFGTPRQIAYIVKDIELAMNHWIEKLDVGPFFYRERAEVVEMRYYGIPVDTFPNLSFGIANSGEMQIELIQQHDDVPTVYNAFLEHSPGGVQHTAYWTTEFDEKCRHLTDRGYVNAMDGRMGTKGRYAYFEHPQDPGNFIEISEQTGGKAEYFASVAEAARTWDGSDPIRVAGGSR